MSTTAEDLVRRFYDDVWNASDENAARTILAPDFRFRGSLGQEKIGPEGFIDYMRSVHAALADYQCMIDDLVATETRAAARMTFGGVHRADFFGVPATGRRISWSGAAFFSISDGQFNDVWVLGDIDAIKAQLR